MLRGRGLVCTEAGEGSVAGFRVHGNEIEGVINEANVCTRRLFIAL